MLRISKLILQASSILPTLSYVSPPQNVAGITPTPYSYA